MKIYFDLDSVMDTRLSLLKMLFPISAEDIIPVDYMNRISNNFKFINSKVFEKVYAERDERVVADYPMPTSGLDFINDLILTTKMHNTSLNMIVEVTLNIYPYNFDMSVIKELAGVIKSKLVNGIKLQVIREKNIGVEHVKKNYDHMVMYNGIRWLTEQLENGNLSMETNLTDVLMITPALMDNEVSMDVEEDVFNAIMTSLTPYIELELISVAVMSGMLIKEK